MVTNDEVMMATNEEEAEDGGGDVEEDGGGEAEGPLHPKMVENGREEETNYMVKTIDMFEFGGYEKAKGTGGKEPTTTKWAECKNVDDEGKQFVRCRLVTRDFKPRREDPGTIYTRRCRHWKL